ncbi:hypothetical protein KY359_01370 [Candidatus Woesearchaeota archaeon]|nr:hypothetical protein [Candidatus Woesearchaeota archaeon]
MFDLTIPEKSLDDAVLFVERVTNLFDELYAAPKRAGVKGVVASGNERKMMHQALRYLECSLTDSALRQVSAKNAAKIPALTKRLAAMGKLLGFNAQGYIPLEGREAHDTDFARPIANINGMPFFVWRPHNFVLSDLNMAFQRGRWDWRDREIGPIEDSRDNVAYGGGGVTMFTKREGGLSPHGMTFIKSRHLLPKDADTQLQINYCWSFMEGFMNNVHINFREGEVVSTYGSNLVQVLTTGQTEETGDAKQTMEFITDLLKISPKQFLYYIIVSNLSDEHRRDIGVLLRTAEEYTPATLSLPGQSSQAFKQTGLVAAVNDGPTTLESLAGLRREQPKKGIIKRTLKRLGIGNDNQYFTFAEDDDTDPDTLRPTYMDASYGRLDAKQFLDAALPDRYGESSVWVTFRSEAGHEYSAGHLTFNDGDSRIRLISKAKDRKDFLKVQETIAEHTGGSTERDITDRDSDYCSDVHLRKNSHSYDSVKAALRKLYLRRFTDASIESLHMHNVTLDELASSGLPMDRARYGDSILL